MRCGVLSLGVLLAVVLSVRAADPPVKDEEIAKVDKAVDKALAFLQKQQLADGAWSGANRNFGQGNPAVTSLCVMAFLSAGNVPGEGRYGETVEKGIQFVLKCQQANGLIARGAAGNQEMYSHGICTLMLAEAAGMTDGNLGQQIREKLVKAVHIILVAQRTEGEARGGWRYTVAHTDSDMSVTGWQIMALRAAKNVGCDVPSHNIDEAIVFIKKCQDPTTGGFCYQPHSNLSEPCTGTAILALELCGKDQHDSKEVIRAGDFLNKHPPSWNNGPNFQIRPGFGYYGLYYCTQAMFQLGDNYWDSFRPRLHEMLFLNQSPDDGSWPNANGIEAAGGTSYSTAMSVLALTVEYRYLPIYQRGEEPTDK